MKILDTPRSGKLGLAVAFQSRYGLCLREWLAPKNTITPARQRVWSAMGYFARVWSVKLTDPERERWIVAAGNVLSANRMDCGPLTGQQLFESINCARACINLPPFFEAPPAREPFNLSPVGQLTVVDSEQGPRLLLAVNGPVTEDIMVFGQAPCSRGRYKRRNVAYLDLLPPAKDGVADITDMYVAKYGPLRPGTKIFLVTRQQKNGWEGPLKEASATVPGDPASPQPAVPGSQPASNGLLSQPPTGQQALAEPSSPLSPLMHTGGTGDAQGIVALPPPDCRESAEPGVRESKAAESASEGAGPAGGESPPPG